MPLEKREVPEEIEQRHNDRLYNDSIMIGEVRSLYGTGGYRKPIVTLSLRVVELALSASRSLEKTSELKKFRGHGSPEKLESMKKQQEGLRSFGEALLGLLKSYSHAIN